MKNKKIFLVVIIIFVLILIYLCVGRNYILLNIYSNQLYEILLPPETVCISKDKAVGNLYGTGNHLDFVASMEVQSALSEEKLVEYYNDMVEDIHSVDEISIMGLNTYYSGTNIDHSIQQIEVIPKVQARYSYGSSKIFEKTDDVILGTDDLYIIQIKDTHYGR